MKNPDWWLTPVLIPASIDRRADLNVNAGYIYRCLCADFTPVPSRIVIGKWKNIPKHVGAVRSPFKACSAQKALDRQNYCINTYVRLQVELL